MATMPNMSETIETVSIPPRPKFWARELPFLVIPFLTVSGVGYMSMTHKPIVGYWELVALFICGTCIFAGWHNGSENKARWRLVWTQLLHWGAFLAAMNLVFLPSVQAVADADSTSLIVLLLLALGTFIAGVHTASWRIGLNGVVMGACVPAAAWLDQSALFLSLGIILVLLVGAAALWAYWRSRGHS